MPQMTLLDLAKLRDNDAIVGLIEENRLAAPEVNLIPARTITGTTYKTVTRKSFADVGFKHVNEPVTASKSDFEQKMVQCFLLRGLVVIDKALVAASGDAIEDLQTEHSSSVMKASLLRLGKQTFYGVDADAKGFPGLSASVHPTMEVDATGTTAGAKSSVYGVKFGVQDVNYIYGQNISFELSDFREQVVDGVPSFVADLTAWVGLQVGSIYSVGRIKNLTEQNDKKLTDDMIADLLAKMPVGSRPDILFMSRRSARQLQQSRSAVKNQSTDAKGQGGFSPQPVESNGVPISITDSISITEP